MILADTFWESETLRMRYGLSRTESTYVIDHNVLRGHLRPQVIMPSCYGMVDDVRRRMIRQELEIVQARVAHVPCRIEGLSDG